MKSGQEIVDFIDRYMGWAMEQPWAYGQTAAELESIFFVLDHMRQYAITEGDAGSFTRYGKYLGEQGYGSQSFTTDENSLPHFLTNEMKQSFEPFVEFWKGYLAWRDKH